MFIKKRVHYMSNTCKLCESSVQNYEVENAIEFNVGPPYWMRDIWPVMRQESSECRGR